MILVVDDEPGMVRVVQRALEPAGYRVVGCSGAEQALELAATEEPELIISDILMPGMDGHRFRAVYVERFPSRRTPFVFLSALTEGDSIVKALEDGADDYFVKPIEPPVLRARVRALLRRTAPKDPGRFRGDLGQLSLVQVLQHCERTALTGAIEFRTDQGETRVAFEAGQMVVDDDASDKLAELMDLEGGTFIIESRPIPFSEIADARIHTLPPPPVEPIPMGRLSGVEAGRRVFQLQTEYEPSPARQVVTVVILEGKVMQKHTAQPPPGLSEEALRAFMDEQHNEVEQQVRDKIELATRQRGSSPSPAEQEMQRVGEAMAAPVISDKAESSAPPPPLAPEDTAAAAASAEAPAAEAAVADEEAAAEPAEPAVPVALTPEEERVFDSTAPASSASEKDRLFEVALRKWRERDLSGALSLLERAYVLCPDDRALEATLTMVRRKLEAD